MNWTASASLNWTPWNIKLPSKLKSSFIKTLEAVNELADIWLIFKALAVIFPNNTLLPVTAKEAVNEFSTLLFMFVRKIELELLSWISVA